MVANPRADKSAMLALAVIWLRRQAAHSWPILRFTWTPESTALPPPEGPRQHYGTGAYSSAAPNRAETRLADYPAEAPPLEPLDQHVLLGAGVGNPSSTPAYSVLRPSSCAQPKKPRSWSVGVPVVGFRVAHAAGRPVEVASAVLEWFRDSDNRGAVQALVGILAVIVAWLSGLLGLILRRLRSGAERRSGSPGLNQRAESGGVNIGGNARDVTTRVGGRDDPA